MSRHAAPAAAGPAAMRHDRGMHVVFVHGSSRSGAHGWPNQAVALDVRRRRCHFLDLDALVEVEEQRDAVLAALGDGGHVVGHSTGALPALAAAAHAPDVVRSLVLFEPAAFAAARGRPAVEGHVAAMGEVAELARDPRVRDGDLAVRYLTALGAPGAALADPADPALRALGRRLRRRTPPWRVPVAAEVVRRVPTLVVTGGWSAVFDEVAEVLAGHGAARRVLPGFGHRPQDHPDANAVLQEHWADAERARA